MWKINSCKRLERTDLWIRYGSDSSPCHRNIVSINKDEGLKRICESIPWTATFCAVIRSKVGIMTQFIYEPGGFREKRVIKRSRGS